MPLTHTELEDIRANAVCIHDAATVHCALDRVAADITDRLGETLPVVLCVLAGGIIPTGHLLTRLHFPLEVDYLHVTRYRGDTHGKDVQWVCEPEISLQGRTVLVVDDILDEGHTLASILAHCKQEGAHEVCSAVLIQKQHGRCVPEITADYVGLEVDDRYVFGFGMDYKGYLRNLNGIYALGETV
jgi:hypoxanthine phosphoribosyltransferase